MTDLWNFKDTVVVASENWVWLLVALALGVVIGWSTCRSQRPA